MERRYSENTLKKRRFGMILLCAVFVFILGRLLSVTSGEFIQNIMASGIGLVQPSLFKYKGNDEEKAEVPFGIRVFAPALFEYTWREEWNVSIKVEALENGEGEQKQFDFVVQNADSMQEQVAEEEHNEADESGSVHIRVAQGDEISLLQENIFSMRTAQGENIFSTAVPMQTDDRTTLQSYDLSLYDDISSLIKEFYIIDASTTADTELLDIDKLTSIDCTIDKNSQGPHILIYHSHSQEGFADSVPGDVSTTIVGAGEKLTRLLEEEYGYQVLHHTGVYDVPSRDNAYSSALPSIEQVLAENPTIQVVIDLHRDAVAEGTKLVTTIDGKDYARFMFFNGICRSTNGPITYLNNPYLQENLAFSFQSQVIAESYFPGVTRKIYLKAWRYNMHLKPKNMLIELGAQTNTVEEIMNTTEIIAFVIDKVLSGQ